MCRMQPEVAVDSERVASKGNQNDLHEEDDEDNGREQPVTCYVLEYVDFVVQLA